MRNGNIAVSHGVEHSENMNFVGPNLHSSIGLNNQTGGGLPMKYFNGSEDSNAGYYELGAPELESCTTPYGQNHPSSHGVVLDAFGDAKIDAQGLWMGPQLAAGPGGTVQTGGARRKKFRSKKSKSKRRNNKRKK